MAASKKKTSKKVSKKSAAALPSSEGIPEGMEQIGAGYAPAWKPEEQKVIHGKVTGAVREVELTIRKKKQITRCFEVTQKKTGERLTVWESAALKELFEHVVGTGEGPEVWIRYDGVGKKKSGQNAPKLFTVAIKE